MITKGDDNGSDALYGGGIAAIIVSAIFSIVILIALIVNISMLTRCMQIDERINMYEEQNAKIETQIEAVVKQYQEYESGIFIDVGDNTSFVTLVSLYPELKADALVNKQIDVYMINNEKIIKLKNHKIDEARFRWWIYFGG